MNKIHYSKLSAMSILVAAVLSNRNPGYTFEDGTKTHFSDEKLVEVFGSKRYASDLIHDDYIGAEGNDLGGHVAKAIVGLHADLSDLSNIQILNGLNNYDKVCIAQLENEGKIIAKYEQSAAFKAKINPISDASDKQNTAASPENEDADIPDADGAEEVIEEDVLSEDVLVNKGASEETPEVVEEQVASEGVGGKSTKR